MTSWCPGDQGLTSGLVWQEVYEGHHTVIGPRATVDFMRDLRAQTVSDSLPLNSVVSWAQCSRLGSKPPPLWLTGLAVHSTLGSSHPARPGQGNVSLPATGCFTAWLYPSIIPPLWLSNTTRLPGSTEPKRCCHNCSQA